MSKEDVQEAAKDRKITFIEIVSIDSCETICIHIYINGFYKCFFVDASNATSSTWKALKWFVVLNTPALSLRLLTFRFPKKQLE